MSAKDSAPKHYRDYADFLAERFEGKMQKLTVNAGFSCPNRDGTIGRGGCSYCNNASFSPAIGGNSVTAQLERSKQFFARKYPQMRYIAYFQSYTNTHGDPDRLISLYKEALAVDGVDAIIIGTRPDCVSPALLDALADINRRHRVIMEYGAESANDITLRRVNRCHSWHDVENAVEMTRDRGMEVGLHFILGLPGESYAMMMHTIDAINELKPQTVKFHQLQIVKGTTLARQLEIGEMSFKPFDAACDYTGREIPEFTVDQYVDLCCDIINRLDRAVAIERFISQSPADLLISPRWGLKNYQFTNLLHNYLLSTGAQENRYL